MWFCKLYTPFKARRGCKVLSTIALGSPISEIQSGIRQVKTGKASVCQYARLSRKLNKWADQIQVDWPQFSEEDKAALKRLAYDLIEPPKGVQALRLKASVYFRLILLRFKGKEKALYDCCDALDRLTDNILNQIELDDSYLQQEIIDTLEELTSNPNAGESVKPEDVRGWLRNLSDQALSEVR